MGTQPAGAELLSTRSAASRGARRVPLGGWAPEAVLFVVALALRAVLFAGVGSWDPARLGPRIFVGDASHYHRLAVNLVEHGVYSNAPSPPWRPDTFRVPLYPGLLAGVYALGGARPHHAILLQLALSALTAVLLCRTGTLLLGRRVGIVAGAIWAVDYSSVLFSNRLYADTVFALLVLAALYALSRYLVGGGHPASLAAAGAVLGLATLCRPVSLLFPVALAPLVWLAARSPGRALRQWGLLAAAYLLVLSPWMLRNLAVAGRPYVTSMQSRIGEWYLPWSMRSLDSAAPSAATSTRWPSSLGVGAARDLRGFVQGSVRYFTILGSGEYPLILGLPYGRHDALALRQAGFLQWIAATLQHRASPLERAIVAAIAAWLLALYLAAIRGLWLLLQGRRWRQVVLLLSTIAYFVVATGPIAREVRYRLPALPAIVLLAAVGIATPLQIGRRSSAPSSRSAA